MIRILVKNRDGSLSIQTNPESSDRDASWHWTDISEPTEKEKQLLNDLIPADIFSQKEEIRVKKRPRIKLFHESYLLTLLIVSPNTLKSHEMHLFVGKNFLISHHEDNLKAVNDVWHQCRTDEKINENKLTGEVFHRLFERLIEQYYMTANTLEDKIDNLDKNSKKESMGQLNRRVFQIRSELLAFRRIVSPLQDIIQRMLSSTIIEKSDEEAIFLRNINESLSRLMHIIESNMEITSDIRDSYLALTSYRTNSIMQTLTVITTIFMPLTFIAGIYGMNFRYMPELKWHYGYFIVLFLMMGIAICMYFYFRKKGWFED